MNCPRCGAESNPADKFCGHCRERLILVDQQELNQTPRIMNSDELKYKLGLVYYKKGKTQEAIEMWTQVLALNPDHQKARRMIKIAEFSEAP